MDKMSRRHALSQLLTLALMTLGCATSCNSRSLKPAGPKKIAMLEIVDMASSFDEDKFEDLAAQISALPGKSTDNSYEVGPQVLSDRTEISSATVFRKNGNLIRVSVVISDSTCLPISAMVLRTYASGPIYSHDYGRYETITPWIKVTFAPGPSGTCLRLLNAERPPPNDFEIEHLVAMNPIGPLDIQKMDAVLWLLSKEADPSLGKIYKIIETGKTEESSPLFSSETTDKYKIIYARKSPSHSIPFAIALGFSDEPCYPLARALALTGARVDIGLRFDDAAKFQTMSDIATTLYPHKRSPLCLGFIRAFDG